MIEALIVAALLQLADVWSTNRALSGGGRELNPIIAWMMERLGPAWWVPKIALAAFFFGVLAWTYYDGWHQALWAVWGLNAVYVLIVANNVRAAR